ncbi:MAG: thiamine biosynthesis lipoprotein [Haloarculaceae archaeon]|jgi:thiamine biosynthesis lipoprotein
MTRVRTMAGQTLAGLASSLGTATRTVDCCDTTFRVRVDGWGAQHTADRAHDVALRLESQLDAFDQESAVSQLNETGHVENAHVAAVVERALAYRERTDGVFDVCRGRLEHSLKAYLRGDTGEPPDTVPSTTTEAPATVDGDHVYTEVTLDLNGLAKGYIVDRVHEAADGLGRRAFVSGGGDMTPPPGVVEIESPWESERALRHLDTDWAVATTGGYRRRRDGYDHIYQPQTGTVGSRHDLVTVLAARDCLEADALATALAAMPVEEALSLIDAWDGLEAFLVHDGVFHETEGFRAHVATT